MSQGTVEELRKCQELLKEEMNHLKTQMNLIIQILLRKEGDHSSSSLQAYTTPQPWVIPPSQQQSCQQRQNGYQQKNQPSLERKNIPFDQVHFDPVPMPYGQILPYLIQKGLVEPRPLPPVKVPYPPSFDVNARCDYHAGSPGHDVENCRAFKFKVQELLDRKLLSFKEGSHS
ncbi:gag-pol polyprotein [Trifolium medium]|uniref:Gag-pol polyprotein n=1 Tax=Trifolium medium TaxID=97028 RepID=A0A392MDY3_9FABA|nr:gag-pol polyprotein [Trifolium medium]